MRCLRCGNTEEKYFYQDNHTWYCRKCIAFGRVNLNELPKRVVYEKKKHDCEYTLKYPLTTQQKKVSQEICYYLSHHCSVLTYAVCGARKNRIGYGSNKDLFT